MTDVPKTSSIGLIPVFEASATLFAIFGSSLSPVSQEQIVIKARYESASASVAKDESDVVGGRKDVESEPAVYANPSMPSSNSIGLVPIHEASATLFAIFRSSLSPASNEEIVIKSQPVTVAAPKFRVSDDASTFLQAGMAEIGEEKVSMLPVAEFVPVAPKAELFIEYVSKAVYSGPTSPIVPILPSPVSVTPLKPKEFTHVNKEEVVLDGFMASKKSQRGINAETDVIGPVITRYFPVTFETGENPFAVLFDDSYFSGIKIGAKKDDGKEVLERKSPDINGKVKKSDEFLRQSCQDSSCAELKAKTKWRITKPPPPRSRRPPRWKKMMISRIILDLLNLLCLEIMNSKPRLLWRRMFLSVTIPFHVSLRHC
jgi:hypothetical protein